MIIRKVSYFKRDKLQYIFQKIIINANPELKDKINESDS